MADAVDLVRRSLAPETRAEFDRRVEEQAAALIEQIRDGDLDNADTAIGLELEGYFVDDAGRVTPLAKGTFDSVPVAGELGLHNFEINTPAAVFDAEGIAAQHRAIEARLADAERVAAEAGVEVMLDGMWTVPPAEGTLAYFERAEERDGLIFPDHMSASPRYHALDNDIRSLTDGEIVLELPNATVRTPTILVESLTSSIQPHLQVPSVTDFVEYYNTAIRTLGPVLALATNSPFLPADLYEDADPEAVLAETYHELRIPVFEQSINAGREPGKVRFPDDLAVVEDAVRYLVADAPVAPFLREWVDEGDLDDGFTDTFWELDHKHGTFWRWLRPVIGGDLIDDVNDEQSLRIEYRPLPTQPSVQDVVALQCLVAGLIHGLVAAEHPLASLEWAAAKRSFYGAMADGLGAELQWVTAEGDRTADPERIYAEVFEYARRGLRDRGVPPETIERYLGPLEQRWESRTTPSSWKRRVVREQLADGANLAEALATMQASYNERTGTPFAAWD